MGSVVGSQNCSFLAVDLRDLLHVQHANMSDKAVQLLRRGGQ